jgi:excinuclease UvrABC nuclease subunit
VSLCLGGEGLYNDFVLTQQVEFAPDRDAEIFAALPAAPAVFLLRGASDSAEPYVSKTANLRRRMQRLLGPPEERTRKLNLREQVRLVEYQPSGSDFESGFLLYQVLRATFPKTYNQRLRLRFAALIRLHLENEYPRASITRRIGRLNGKTLYYGPFASRATAEKFLNDSLDFFKMRRCIDDLHPDPAFPGCIYSEMKMCLAPCFKGCTDADYRAEVARVQEYLDSGGQSFAVAIARLRDKASADLAFEQAAAEHARLDKLKPVLSQLPEAVHRLDRLAALMIQPCAQAESVALFRVDRPHITGPIAFAIQSAEHARSQSMEARIQQALEAAPPSSSRSALETMEHLAILKRWFYRGTRVGEIFFADPQGNLPMRRIVRGISRVYRGEKPEPAAPQAT